MNQTSEDEGSNQVGSRGAWLVVDQFQQLKHCKLQIAVRGRKWEMVIIQLTLSSVCFGLRKRDGNKKTWSPTLSSPSKSETVLFCWTWKMHVHVPMLKTLLQHVVNKRQFRSDCRSKV